MGGVGCQMPCQDLVTLETVQPWLIPQVSSESEWLPGPAAAEAAVAAALNADESAA